MKMFAAFSSGIQDIPYSLLLRLQLLLRLPPQHQTTTSNHNCHCILPLQLLLRLPPTQQTATANRNCHGKLPLLLPLLLLLQLPTETSAQDTRHTTLFGWEERTQHIIKDRYHNHGGIFYDRGLYRFTTPGMTREHELDLITLDFTTVDDYNWFYRRENSLRGFAGSYNLGEFIHGAVIRNQVPITDNLRLPIHFTRRYDMHSDRALLELAFDYNISGRHNAGISHTLTEQKPDLDATFYYRFGDFSEGFAQIEFTALDWGNNAAYELSQRRGTVAPELQKYEVSPFLFSIRASFPVIGNLRSEVVGGFQTPQQSVAESVEGSDEMFRDRERTRYLGLLLEYAIPGFTTAVSWQHRYARFSRTNAEEEFDEPVDYGNFQVHNSLGLFVSFSYRGFFIDNWLWRNYNRDKQFDEHEERFRSEFRIYPFDFEENRTQMRNRLGYDPVDRGFKAAVEWSADYRDFLRGTVDHPSHGIIHAFDYRSHYIRHLSNRQERLSLFIGYRFTRDIYFEAGASYDVDGDVYRGAFDQAYNETPSRFDGGFGRLVLYW
jgi:hypothetical protein